MKRAVAVILALCLMIFQLSAVMESEYRAGQVPAGTVAQAEMVVTAETVVPMGTVVSAEVPVPTEMAATMETVAPTEAAAPVETTAPVGTVIPTETATPVETTAPVETVTPTETDAPTETAMPIETAAPMETLVPTEAATPEETAAPVETAGLLTILGFDGFDGVTALETMTVPYGTSENELCLPASLTAQMSDGSNAPINVTWACESDFSGGTAYVPDPEDIETVYVFRAALKEDIPCDSALPFVFVVFEAPIRMASLSSDPGYTIDQDGVLNITGSVNLNAVSGSYSVIWVVETGEITGGDATQSVTVATGGVISGGTYSGNVSNCGTICDGSFNGAVHNDGVISGGTFNAPVRSESGSSISGGTFSCDVNSYSTISNGTFNSTVYNYDAISGGIFNVYVVSELGSCTISGGTFGGNVMNLGTISGGIFSGPVECTGYSTISGGTFSASVDNESGSTISGGTFTTANNYGVITGGIFSANVKSVLNSTISGGTFNGAVTNAGTISDGTFNGTASNRFPSGYILGGTFSGDVINDNTISDGTFSGSVTNNSRIHDGTFGCPVTNTEMSAIDGGTYNGTVANYRFILRGTFNGTVTNCFPSGEIHSGTFNGAVSNEFRIFNGIFNGTVSTDVSLSSSIIFGGTFNNDVTNNNIYGGTFNADVTNDNISDDTFIYGGTFNGAVSNDGAISGGTFSGAVSNNGTISNGTFSGTVTNCGTISGGTFSGAVTNNGTISGGTLSGAVSNFSTISGGAFNGPVANGGAISGGTFGGGITGSGALGSGAMIAMQIDGQNREIGYGQTISSYFTVLGTTAFTDGAELYLLQDAVASAWMSGKHLTGVARAELSLVRDEWTYGDAISADQFKLMYGSAKFSVANPKFKVTGSSKEVAQPPMGAGAYQMVCTFGAYNYTIAPKAVDVQWSQTEFVYDGSAHMPAATFTDLSGKSVSLNVISAQTAAGTYSATAETTDANYELTGATVNWYIRKATPSVTWPVGLKITYGQALSEVSLSSPAGGTFGWASPDRVPTCAEGESETFRLIYTPDDANYSSADNDVSVCVAPKPLTDGSIAVSMPSDRAYTGKNIRPAVVLHDGGVELTKGADYTVAYKDNQEIGTAKMIITGIGNYTGTLRCSFEITARNGGADNEAQPLMTARDGSTVSYESERKENMLVITAGPDTDEDGSAVQLENGRTRWSQRSLTIPGAYALSQAALGAEKIGFALEDAMLVIPISALTDGDYTLIIAPIYPGEENDFEASAFKANPPVSAGYRIRILKDGVDIDEPITGMELNFAAGNRTGDGLGVLYVAADGGSEMLDAVYTPGIDGADAFITCPASLRGLYTLIER